MLPFSMKPIPPNILTSRIAPAPERAARTWAARSLSAVMRSLRGAEQRGQSIESAMPAGGMALEGVRPRQPLVANQKLGAAAVGLDRDGHHGFDAGVHVGRLDDPGKHDLRGRYD